MTTILCVVSLVDQVFPLVALEVKVTLPPWQKVVAPLEEIVGVVGTGFTVTSVDAEVAVQPLALATVTEYVPEVVTTILCVVSPVDQVFPLVALEVKVTLPPWQKVVAPLAEMVGVVGFEFTVTVVVADVAEQPFAPVTVTV